MQLKQTPPNHYCMSNTLFMSHAALCLKETGGGGGGMRLNELGKATVRKAEFLAAGKVYKAIF